MAAQTVRVTGLKETRRALNRVDKDSAKELRKALKDAAEPVRAAAASLFAPVSPRSAAGYRVAVRARGVAVEQRLGRTTGQHPEFGARQMREALLPALLSKEGDVVDGVERALDMLVARNGF
jgi:hypothetical protein